MSSRAQSTLDRHKMYNRYDWQTYNQPAARPRLMGQLPVSVALLAPEQEERAPRLFMRTIVRAGRSLLSVNFPCDVEDAQRARLARHDAKRCAAHGR